MCEEHTHEPVGEEEEGKRRRREREGVGSRQGSREIVGDVGQPETGSTRRFAAVRGGSPHHLVDGRTRLEHVVEARNRRLDDHGHVAVTQLSEALDAALGLQDRHHLWTRGEGGGVGEMEGEMLAGMDGV